MQWSRRCTHHRRRRVTAYIYSVQRAYPLPKVQIIWNIARWLSFSKILNFINIRRRSQAKNNETRRRPFQRMVLPRPRQRSRQVSKESSGSRDHLSARTPKSLGIRRNKKWRKHLLHEQHTTNPLLPQTAQKNDCRVPRRRKNHTGSQRNFSQPTRRTPQP